MGNSIALAKPKNGVSIKDGYNRVIARGLATTTSPNRFSLKDYAELKDSQSTYPSRAYLSLSIDPTSSRDLENFQLNSRSDIRMNTINTTFTQESSREIDLG